MCGLLLSVCPLSLVLYLMLLSPDFETILLSVGTAKNSGITTSVSSALSIYKTIS